MIRAVIDANVIISGLFWHGTPRQVYQAAAQGDCVMLTSESLVDELRHTLSKQKFVPYLAVINLTIDDIMAQRVTPVEVPLNIVRDPKDRAVLACAVGGKADYVVSGDKDLLVLTVYETIPILNVEQFLSHLGRATP